MRLVLPVVLVVLLASISCESVKEDAAAARAYTDLRDRSEQVAFAAVYHTLGPESGDVVVRALPPARRLDAWVVLGGQSRLMATFYLKPDLTLRCDFEREIQRCDQIDETDPTVHAPAVDPNDTRVEAAPERTIAAAAATCFNLVARRDSGDRRELCFSPTAVLVYASGHTPDGQLVSIEARRVTGVTARELDPLAAAP